MYSNLVSTQTKQEEKGNDKYNKESDKVIKELDDIDNITESEFVSTNELFSKHSSKKKQTRLKVRDNMFIIFGQAICFILSL